MINLSRSNERISIVVLSSLTTINDPSFESTLRKCGDFGRFQWMHFFFINLLTMSGGLVSFLLCIRCSRTLNIDVDYRQMSGQMTRSYYAMNLTHEYYLNQIDFSDDKYKSLGTMCTDSQSDSDWNVLMVGCMIDQSLVIHLQKKQIWCVNRNLKRVG